MFMIYRKIACFILTIILLYSGATYASAADTTVYVLDENGMSVSLPSHLVVFTRFIDEDDPYLAAIGIKKEELISDMAYGDYYLMANDADTFIQFKRIDISKQFDGTAVSNDTLLSALITYYSEEYKSKGMKILESEIY